METRAVTDDAAEIGPGSRVCMHFALHLPDGTEVESSFDGEPLCFAIGDGTLIEGLELALYGLRAGQEQELIIPPESGFGYRDPENVHSLPRTDFEGHDQLRAGMIIGFTTPSGEEVAGAVIELDDDTVKVDFNHPLAGREIGFRVRILEVGPAARD